MKFAKKFGSFVSSAVSDAKKKIAGEEIARVSLNSLSTESNPCVDEVSFRVEEDDDIKLSHNISADSVFEEDESLAFLLKVYKDGEWMEDFELNVFETTKYSSEGFVDSGRTSKWSSKGRNGSLYTGGAGDFTIKVKVTSDLANRYQLYKADLIFKR